MERNTCLREIMTGILVFLLVFLSAAATRTYAAEQISKTGNSGTSGQNDTDSEKEKGFNLGKQIDKTHKKISEYIFNSAEWLDSFFGDHRFSAEDNRTRVKLRTSAFTDSKDGFDIGAGASFRLVLPNLEKRWHIVVSGSSADDDFRETKNSTGDVRKDFVKAEENDFSLALQYFIKTTSRNNIRIESGIRWRDNEPVLFAGPRYRWYKQISDPWALRFTQQFRWYTDEGWYIRSAFDMERPVSEKFFFRSSAEGVWQEEEEGYSYSFGLSLYHTLSPGRVLEYQIGNNYETRPVHVLDEVSIRVRYRQRLWRDWLRLEISPQVTLPREEDYEIVPGIFVQLEVEFGKYLSPEL